MILNRRSFIKGLIRCVPAVVVPSLVFDCKPKWEKATHEFITDWKWVNPPEVAGMPVEGYFKPMDIAGWTPELVGGEILLSPPDVEKVISILQKRPNLLV